MTTAAKVLLVLIVGGAAVICFTMAGVIFRNDMRSGRAPRNIDPVSCPASAVGVTLSVAPLVHACRDLSTGTVFRP